MGAWVLNWQRKIREVGGGVPCNADWSDRGGDEMLVWRTGISTSELCLYVWGVRWMNVLVLPAKYV